MNLEVIEGDTTNYTFTITPPTGDLTDYLAGATVYFTVKSSRNDADVDAILQKTVTTHTGVNETVITLAPSDTRGKCGSYYYDIQVTDADSNITTYFLGELKITKDVTKQ